MMNFTVMLVSSFGCLSINLKEMTKQMNFYYAPCPAKGRAPPKAVNGEAGQGAKYFGTTS